MHRPAATLFVRIPAHDAVHGTAVGDAVAHTNQEAVGEVEQTGRRVRYQTGEDQASAKDDGADEGDCLAAELLKQFTADDGADGPEGQHGRADVGDSGSLPAVVGGQGSDKYGCCIDDAGAEEDDQTPDHDAGSVHMLCVEMSHNVPPIPFFSSIRLESDGHP